MHYRIKHGSIKVGERFAVEGEVVALSPMDAGAFAEVLEDVEPAAPDGVNDPAATKPAQPTTKRKPKP